MKRNEALLASPSLQIKLSGAIPASFPVPGLRLLGGGKFNEVAAKMPAPDPRGIGFLGCGIATISIEARVSLLCPWEAGAPGGPVLGGPVLGGPALGGPALGCPAPSSPAPSSPAPERSGPGRPRPREAPPFGGSGPGGSRGASRWERLDRARVCGAPVRFSACTDRQQKKRRRPRGGLGPAYWFPTPAVCFCSESGGFYADLCGRCSVSTPAGPCVNPPLPGSEDLGERRPSPLHHLGKRQQSGSCP
ncbi:unnamed protein product [Rangifer tarandus platyrhynchus]|uniref:Uncharacterized protein n=2 Tax=Rangifer tarandus platyrhynchus TaxID=3082113 RepID=A0ACB0EZK7_RANTA|nr:unnamed protein product [Rangifer tarandus platyrhynchus]CAI9706018.1 unnamed protein product [Rangifer tarandus platyrhynchus]